MSTISNICNYKPIISLSIREIDSRFKIVHRYLCYLGGAASSNVSAGNNGVALSSISSGTLVLGQDVSQSGNPAILLSSRQIPMGGFHIALSGTTGNLLIGTTTSSGTDRLQVSGNVSFVTNQLRFTNGGFGGAPAMVSTSFLTILNTSNLIACQGVGTTATSHPEWRFTGVGAGTALNFCGIINGFNFNAATGPQQPLLIATSGLSASTNLITGDIILRCGTDGSNGNWTGQFGNASILLQPAGTGVVTITNNGANIPKLGVGITPTARVHIAAGTATANTAPIKFTSTSSVLLTTPELGALEFVDDGTIGHLYITRNVAGVVTRTLIV